jgi:oxalate decarboxylase/phosphoglucose isomerase-like protein (cupin superfamily)
MKKDNVEHLDRYDDLLRILTENVEVDGKTVKLKDDFEKFFVRSNKTAGVRVRKIMQMIRKTAEDIRNEVQEYKKNI